MSASTHHAGPFAPATHLDKGRSGSLLKIGGALLAIGLLLTGAAFASDVDRAAFSYLTGFFFVLTIGLGGLFFVLIQHVTKAGWSVGPRRQAEWIAGVLPVMGVLFIPVALLAPRIWNHWWHPHDALVQAKTAYLNPTFFYIRAVVYFLVWTALSMAFRRGSLAQDQSGDPAISLRLQARAAPSLFAFAFSLTFAAFDWLMSLNPHWYSTIFGVYIFAGGVVSSLATLALLTLWLQGTGLLGKVSTVEHQHDIGKLLFGFTVFWAYIGFSQFFLIWYANIPEETIYYRVRWQGGWDTVSLVLLFGHFFVPFALLMSRHAKRNRLVLALGSILLIAMHYVDVYWMILPEFGREAANIDGVPFAPHWMDLACVLLPVGAFVTWLGVRAGRDPLYPLRDPRLAEAVKLQNL